MTKKMTKNQVLAEFREYIAPLVREQHGRDSIAMREAFNDFVDYLNKERRVTDHQAYTCSNPY